MCDIFVQVSAVVKQCMEGAINLCVPLEVKMKSGPSWGSLTDYPIPVPVPVPVPVPMSVPPPGPVHLLAPDHRWKSGIIQTGSDA